MYIYDRFANVFFRMHMYSVYIDSYHIHAYIVQRHSKKYETNCSKSTKIGTHVD